MTLAELREIQGETIALTLKIKGHLILNPTAQVARTWQAATALLDETGYLADEVTDEKENT